MDSHAHVAFIEKCDANDLLASEQDDFLYTIEDVLSYSSQ